MSTFVFVHAHPDDEVLLTGGSMAMLAAQGHRVVLVTATAGERGLTATSGAPLPGAPLAGVRCDELRASAEILGCARLVLLGFPDSGSTEVSPSGSFADIPVEVSAARLAEVLDEERADVVTGYDEVGGYGHRDHVRVHHVARAAVRLVGTATLLEATVDRRALTRALRFAAPFTRNAPDFRPQRFDHLYTAHDMITHRIDVRSFIRHKRAAMRVHASQATADAGVRSLARFLSLPLPAFQAVFGREWYVEPGAGRHKRPLRQLRG